MKEIRSIFEDNFRTIELLCDKSNETIEGPDQPCRKIDMVHI